MLEAVEDVKKDHRVRSLIICSLVPGIFCAGLEPRYTPPLRRILPLSPLRRLYIPAPSSSSLHPCALFVVFTSLLPLRRLYIPAPSSSSLHPCSLFAVFTLLFLLVFVVPSSRLLVTLLTTGADLKERANMHQSEVAPFVSKARALITELGNGGADPLGSHLETRMCFCSLNRRRCVSCLFLFFLPVLTASRCLPRLPPQGTSPCRPSPPSTAPPWEAAWRWPSPVTSESPVRPQRVHENVFKYIYIYMNEYKHQRVQTSGSAR